MFAASINPDCACLQRVTNLAMGQKCTMAMAGIKLVVVRVLCASASVYSYELLCIKMCSFLHVLVGRDP